MGAARTVRAHSGLPRAVRPLGVGIDVYLFQANVDVISFNLLGKCRDMTSTFNLFISGPRVALVCMLMLMRAPLAAAIGSANSVHPTMKLLCAHALRTLCVRTSWVLWVVKNYHLACVCSAGRTLDSQGRGGYPENVLGPNAFGRRGGGGCFGQTTSDRRTELNPVTPPSG